MQTRGQVAREPRLAGHRGKCDCHLAVRDPTGEATFYRLPSTQNVSGGGAEVLTLSKLHVTLRRTIFLLDSYLVLFQVSWWEVMLFGNLISAVSAKGELVLVAEP